MKTRFSLITAAMAGVAFFLLQAAPRARIDFLVSQHRWRHRRGLDKRRIDDVKQPSRRAVGAVFGRERLRDVLWDTTLRDGALPGRQPFPSVYAGTRMFQIPRVPEVGVAGGPQRVLSHTAVLINGVPTFNALDAFSYQNQGVWNQNAIYFENAGFDCQRSPCVDPITITRCRRLSATASHQPAMSAMTIPAKRYSRLTLRVLIHLLAGRLTDIRFAGRLGTTVRTARAASFELKRDTASGTWPTGPPCRMARWFWRPTSTDRTSTK